MQIGRKRLSLTINLRTFAIVIAIILLWAVFAVASDGSFITRRNLSNLFRQMSIVGVLGTGALLVIVSGNIDLSVGLLAGFCGCVGAILMSYHGWGTISAVLAMLAVGAVFGLAQGYVVAYVGVPSFIATLGGQMILRGFTLGLTKGVTITPINGSFLVFGQSYFGNGVSWTMGGLVVLILLLATLIARRSNAKYHFENARLSVDLLKWVVWSCLIALFVMFMTGYEGIPVPVFIVILLAVILTFVAEGTTFGRRIYIIGGNVEAARYSGINVKGNLIVIFLLNGTIAAIAGVLLTSRQAAGLPSSGTNMELDAIAAAVIGGASMMGGSGRVFGV